MPVSARPVCVLLLLVLVSWVALKPNLNQLISYVSSSEQITEFSVRNVDNSKSDHNKELARLGLKPKKSVEITIPGTGEKRLIHGRFLHITDFHPDPHYKPGSDIDEMCHVGKGDAGEYGDAILGCDSPLSLVESTIDWIADNLKDKIDFIVWTGDNMRHDNDRRFPRSESDIFAMNDQISSLMNKKFGNMPVPSLGNNDVYPHNLFAPGPTLQTREFFRIWRPFVPQAQLHVFNRGVYFFQEVIPGKLAVLSINTLYLFQSNPLVESCDKRKDPGYNLFLWLGYVLKEMRQRNMKVWLTGHVPPSAKNYDISCLRKYILWSHEYRDVIVGGLYGHMNIDHFFPLDSKQAYRSMKAKFRRLGYDIDENMFETLEADSDSDSKSESESDSTQELASLEDLYAFYNISTVHDTIDSLSNELGFDLHLRDIEIQGGIPQRKVEYMENIRKSTYAAVKGKKKSGDFGERYSVVHVASSVVPTFNPGMRVWEYNISDLYDMQTLQVQGWDQFFENVDKLLESDSLESDSGIEYNDEFATFKQKAGVLKRDKTIPRKMPKNTPLGPAYVPQLFTPERYVNYYLDLKAINEKKKAFEYEIEYTTDDKSTYRMKDLTVQEWLNLARRLGKPVKEGKKGKAKMGKKKDGSLSKLWKEFLAHSFVNSHYEDMGYG